MPEQPPDPLHYDMKIPPEPDHNKQHAPEKPASDENEDASQTARDTSVVRGSDKNAEPQGGRGNNDRQ
ncbi:hypothetical protein [Occallatibacter savannae]|uniref:hypothetical protein n=1 Tax=Occallatibacter savannae TaxID=1002691 RepID=UPI000D691DF3|nr:hypothetical protein [Occallatibacter savannae]